MRRVNYSDNPFPYVFVDNFYNEHELKLIWQELDFLCYSDKLEGPHETAGSLLEDKSIAKQNRGLFLDETYYKRSVSNILKVNRKSFDLFQDLKNSEDICWWFKHGWINSDKTLLSYYENAEYYKPHHDVSTYTFLTWFFREPKKFKGGNLKFSDYHIDIECVNNRLIIFPSVIKHEVSEVIMKEEDVDRGFGRWCMTQFGDLRTVYRKKLPNSPNS